MDDDEGWWCGRKVGAGGAEKKSSSLLYHVLGFISRKMKQTAPTTDMCANILSFLIIPLSSIFSPCHFQFLHRGFITVVWHFSSFSLPHHFIRSSNSSLLHHPLRFFLSVCLSLPLSIYVCPSVCVSMWSSLFLTCHMRHTT